MNVYYSKNEEYLDCLKKSRKVENSNNSILSQAHDDQKEENTIELALRKLKLIEFERDLANLRGLLSNIVIPKLLMVEPSEVYSLLKVIKMFIFIDER